MHRLLAALALTVIGLGALAGARPGPALASCAFLPGQDLLADAEVVFVGTVTAVENMNRRAAVTVEEIWRGADLPAQVIVHGGPDDPNTASSVDRTFDVGKRYIFGVALLDGELHDNACSGTREVAAGDVARLRPDDARTPTGDLADDSAFDLGALAGPAIIAGVIGLLVAVVVFANRRREA